MKKETEEIKKNSKSGKILLNIFIFIILASVGLYGYARYIGTSGLIVKEYLVASKKLPNNFSGIKIVHFSDVHLESTIFIKDLENMVEKINELKPDIVIFTGDLVYKNHKISEKESNNIIKILSNVDSTIGKYAVIGNDDYKNKYFEKIMLESGFKILNNTYELIYYENNDPIYIAGLSSYLKGDYNIETAFDSSVYTILDNEMYKILLSHEPDVFEELSKKVNVDLMLAGHSLNGSVVIPYYGPLFIPNGSKKYFANSYIMDNTSLYISSGLGTTTFPYRFNNRPSINLYRLKSL